MEYAFGFFFFVLGAVVGSFINVVVLRLGKKSFVGGRSKCPHCHRTLRPLELIPIVSYFLIGGRCKGCKKEISLQYPIVEALTGALFLVLAGTLYGVTENFGVFFVYGAAILALLVAIIVYDFKTTIIPDVFVYPLAALAFLSLWFTPALAFTVPTWLELASGPIIALPFALLWLISKGKWIGLGDAKLALPIGWMLGITGGATAVALAFWCGAFVSVGLLCVSRLRHRNHPLTIKSEIPFAPFLALGAVAAYVSGINFFLII